MSLSNSRLSYTDCFDLLDQALEQSRGLRIEVPDINAANYLRMRIHHARQIDRNENKITYADPDAPLHGRSPYDILVVRIEATNGSGWVYLDKQKVDIGRIEAIPEGYQVDHVPMLRLEGPKPERAELGEIVEPAVPQIRRR